MERTDGASASSEHVTEPVKDDLLSNGRCYSLFQAMRLLRTMLPETDSEGIDNHGTQPQRWETLRIRSHLSLGFPVSGVERIEPRKNGGFTLTTPILGLYGSCSPLPTFYTEDLLSEAAAGESAVRDMLDVINHRIVLLLYDAWSKYRSMVRILEDGDLGLLRRFYHLVGLSRDRLAGSFDNPDRLLRYSGLFAMNSRSAAGLETLLSDALGLPVTVFQMTERTGLIPEEQKARLGLNVCLGKASSLGGEVHGKGGAFRIQVGPVSRNHYRHLTPGARDYRLLVSMTDLYVTAPLEYDVEIVMDRHEQPLTTCLGCESFSSLGLDTWIFSKSGHGEFKTRFHPHDMQTQPLNDTRGAR